SRSHSRAEPNRSTWPWPARSRSTSWLDGPRETSGPLRGRTKKIRRAGFAFVHLVQPAFRFGIAPSSSNRSVVVSTYLRSVLGARRNLCERRHRIKTPRKLFCRNLRADHFRPATHTLS